jgi:hypothetical protein
LFNERLTVAQKLLADSLSFEEDTKEDPFRKSGLVHPQNAPTKTNAQISLHGYIVANGCRQTTIGFFECRRNNNTEIR